MHLNFCKVQPPRPCPPLPPSSIVIPCKCGGHGRRLRRAACRRAKAAAPIVFITAIRDSILRQLRRFQYEIGCAIPRGADHTMLEKFFPSSLPLQPHDDLQQVNAFAATAHIRVAHLIMPYSFQLMAALEAKVDSDGCTKKAKVGDRHVAALCHA